VGSWKKIIIANMIDRAPEMTSIKRKGRSSSLKAKTPKNDTYDHHNDENGAGYRHHAAQWMCNQVDTKE
jgi:hypothetical protein